MLSRVVPHDITLPNKTHSRLTLKCQWPSAVQHESTATLPSSTDLIRPTQARDLRERLTSTSVQLVHTEEVVWSAGLP